MSDCSQHKKEVAGISDMKVLAEMIGDLHYETLSNLLFELQTKLHNDSMNDLKGERYNLSHMLHRASKCIFEASLQIESAWLISKRHMSGSEQKAE
jgi:hypothetical protein